jgi:hypothetical protein
MVVVCGAVELSSAGKHPVEREVGLSGGGCCLRSEAPLLQLDRSLRAVRTRGLIELARACHDS